AGLLPPRARLSFFWLSGGYRIAWQEWRKIGQRISPIGLGKYRHPRNCPKVQNAVGYRLQWVLRSGTFCLSQMANGCYCEKSYRKIRQFSEYPRQPDEHGRFAHTNLENCIGMALGMGASFERYMLLP